MFAHNIPIWIGSYKYPQVNKFVRITQIFLFVNNMSGNVRERTFWFVRPTRSNQPAHLAQTDQTFPCSHEKKTALQNAANEGSDQNVRCAGWSESSPGASCPKVRFLTLRLKSLPKSERTYMYFYYSLCLYQATLQMKRTRKESWRQQSNIIMVSIFWWVKKVGTIFKLLAVPEYIQQTKIPY